MFKVDFVRDLLTILRRGGWWGEVALYQELQKINNERWKESLWRPLGIPVLYFFFWLGSAINSAVDGFSSGEILSEEANLYISKVADQLQIWLEQGLVQREKPIELTEEQYENFHLSVMGSGYIYALKDTTRFAVRV